MIATMTANMTAIRSLSAALAVFTVSGGVAVAASPMTNLNMRSGPGTGYQVIGVIPAGAPVDVLGCGGRWCRVSYAGRMGYANGSYLSGDPRTAIVAPGAAAYASSYGYGSGSGFGSNYGGPGYGYASAFPPGGYRMYSPYDSYASGYSGYYGPGVTIGIGSSWNPAWRGGHN
jgi:hypothetical protein